MVDPFKRWNFSLIEKEDHFSYLPYSMMEMKLNNFNMNQTSLVAFWGFWSPVVTPGPAAYEAQT